MGNAYEIPNLRFSLPAGAAVERHRFVSVNSTGKGVQATASTQVIGASMNKTADGQVLEIAEGIVMVTAGEAITSGSAISSDANGKAITATAQSQDGTSKVVTAGSLVAGIAMTDAAAGGLVAVKIN